MLLTIFLDGFSQGSVINITQISPRTYVHESFLQTQEWGRVSCNGLIFINENKAVVFDTPASEEATKVLINIIQDSLKAKIIGLVVNHFHADCLAGLQVFHQLNIPSYANNKTVVLAKAHQYEIPQHGFEKKLFLNVEGDVAANYYFGGAHTIDNIVSYIPAEKVLFGGCMVKALGASKGNLADADLKQWSKTINKVKKLKPTIVIPGHGNWGGAELLDYTERLFRVEE